MMAAEPGQRRTKIKSDIGRFGMVPAWILESAVSDRAIRLFATMACKYADFENKEAEPSRADLARDLRVAQPKTIDGAMRELKAIGAVSVVHRRTTKNLNDTNLYRLNFARPQQSAEAPSIAPHGTLRSVPPGTIENTPRSVPSGTTGSVPPDTRVVPDGTHNNPDVDQRSDQSSDAPAPKALTAAQQLVEDHRLFYKAKFHVDPKKAGPPEFTQSAAIIKNRGGYENALELLVGFFDSTDPAIRNCGYDFLKFVMYVGRVQVELARRNGHGRAPEPIAKDANQSRRQVRNANIDHVAAGDFHIVGDLPGDAPSPEAP